MVKYIDLYHYGDYGKYDKKNPIYIYSKDSCKEILYLIASSKKFSLSKVDLVNELAGDEKVISEVIDLMEDIAMISRENDKYSIGFTIILEEDINEINKFSIKLADKIRDIILLNSDEIYGIVKAISCRDKFSMSRILYHLIACSIFDGSAIDEFSKRGLFKTSKQQVGNRDYILFGFENNESVFNLSDNLLCSCNNVNINNNYLMSFGDSNGARKDFYRFFRQVNEKLKDTTTDMKLNISYIRLIEEYNKIITKDSLVLLKKINESSLNINDMNEHDKNLVSFIEELEYICVDESGEINIIVPYFNSLDLKILDELSEYIIELIYPILKEGFNAIKQMNISAVKHGVDIYEIANELWHQVFGNANEILVKEQFFKAAENIEDENIENYICIVPTKEFQLEKYKERLWVHDYLSDCKDSELAYDNWMKRDVKYACIVSAGAVKYKQNLIVVDGKRTENEIYKQVKEYFNL
jgi:hypothetical protein